VRKNQALLSSDDDIATEIATILSIDEETKRASVQFEDETILPSIEFFYHCMPDDVENGYQAFSTEDKVIVAERKYIIGFEDLKPKPCEIIILAGTSTTIGNTAKILKSVDMGLTWEFVISAFGEDTVRGIVGLAGRVVLAGTNPSGKILRSVDNGLNWTDLGSQFGEPWIVDIIDVGNGICLAATGYGGKILRSIDYGASWTDLGRKFNQIVITELAYAGDGICLATTYGKDSEDRWEGKIIRSANYGVSWSVVYESQESGLSGWYFDSIAHLENGILIAGSVWWGYYYRSTNYGMNWTKMDKLDGRSSMQAPTNVGDGIALIGYHEQYGDHEAHICRSTNYGLTFINLGHMFNQTWIYELAYIGSGICLSGTAFDGLILRSTDKGLNWTSLGNQGGQAGITSIKRINVGF
jgi:photosystem II stability/assembly factor-like uncharacterized protein